MNWLLSFVVALFSGVLGLVCSGLIANACVSWYRISSFEGKSGFFVIFAALGGLIAGVILGLVMARVVAAGVNPGFPKALGFALGAVLTIAAVATALCWGLADIPPKIEGRELTLELELRLPAGHSQAPSSMTGDAKTVLGSFAGKVRRAYKDGNLRVAEARKEEGRWVIPASVELFTMRGQRAVDFILGSNSVAGFLIPLPARPDARFESWSGWLPNPPAGYPPWPDSKPSYRFRVQRIAPPPPPPSAAEVAAEEEAQEKAKFDAVDPRAPIREWLPYTRYGIPEARKEAALKNITSRPGFIDEFAQLVHSKDREEAAEALHLIPQLPVTPPELVPVVTEFGRRLIEQMRTSNSITAEQDPSYEWAADISVRFNAWHVAVEHLRNKLAADFIPELKIILELSRIRTDSHVMRSDVCRVASYYLHQWAGIDPLPTDPKPR